MYECFVCMYVYASMPDVHRDQKWPSDPLELNRVPDVDHSVGSENQTWAHEE